MYMEPIVCAAKVTSDTRRRAQVTRQHACRAWPVRTLVQHSTRSVRSAPSVAMGFCGRIRRRCVMCVHRMPRWRRHFVCAMPGRFLGPRCNVCRVRKTTCVRGHFPVQCGALPRPCWCTPERGAAWTIVCAAMGISGQMTGKHSMWPSRKTQCCLETPGDCGACHVLLGSFARRYPRQWCRGVLP